MEHICSNIYCTALLSTVTQWRTASAVNLIIKGETVTDELIGYVKWHILLAMVSKDHTFKL